MEHTGRDLVQYDLGAIHIQGMTRIGPALEPCDHIVTGSKIIHDLTLSFIAPLKT
jgi:hypothetical protein